MNQPTQTFHLVSFRAILFSADTIFILIIIGTPLYWIATLTNVMPSHLSFFLSEYYAQYMYVIPLLGAAWLYNRVRAKRANPMQVVTIQIGCLDNRLLSTAAIAIGVIAAFLVAVDNAILPGIGLFAGVAVASGAGAALKHRMVGRIGERTQFGAALGSAVALLGGSWLASWAYIVFDGTVIPGGYLAPTLGIFAGMFVPLEPIDTPIFASDNAP